MKTTRVLPLEHRPAEEWIAVDVGTEIVVDATLGQNFRFILDRDATLRIDRGTSGARVRIRVEQDSVGGHALAPNLALVFRNGESTLPILSAAGAVTEIEAQYDELAQAFEILTPIDRTRGAVLFATSTSVAAVAADLATLTGSLGSAAFVSTATFDVAGAAATAQTNAQNFATAAISALALGTMSTQNANAVAISGGSIAGATVDVPAHYSVLGTQVVGTQGAAVADSSGILLDLTTQFNTLLARLRAHGLIST